MDEHARINLYIKENAEPIHRVLNRPPWAVQLAKYTLITAGGLTLNKQRDNTKTYMQLKTDYTFNK